jgi:hypothetical protein
MTARSLSLLLAAALCVLVAGCGSTQRPATVATCAAYANQAQAQRAADTADPDHDGRFCESLPCPCAPGSGRAERPAATQARCTSSRAVVTVAISSTKYPAVLDHIASAVRAGWPQVLTLHRPGAQTRRARALAGIPTRPRMDRDEWPMAFARCGWRADVTYVPAAQNRGAGSSIALKLRRYCDGVRFRVIGY